MAQLDISSDTLSQQQLFDYGLNFLRIQLFTIPGFASPAPMGGVQRQVMVNLDPTALYANGLSPADVGSALAQTNAVIPSGNAWIGNDEYNVDINMSPETVAAFNQLPLRMVNRVPIHVGDIAPVSDTHQPQTNIVRVDGRVATFLMVIKHAAASTLAVVDAVKERIPQLLATAPKGLKVALTFDQSKFVRAALGEVVRESSIAATLVALLALVFLGSPRSMLIVVISIPLSILTAIVGLKLSGQTLNIMTLGGLALAVGMLVDDATVEIENIHRNHAMHKPLVVAILDGATQIATPTLVGTLSICIVFFPVLLLSGVAKFLFTPLAMAVVYAMLTSYLLSRSLVTTMAHHLLPDTHDEHTGEGWWDQFVRWFNAAFDRFAEGYRRALESFVQWRPITLTAVAFMVVVSLFLVKVAGEDFFPTVDAGMMRLHVRAPTGTRLERTELIVDRIEHSIGALIQPDDFGAISDNIGLPVSYNLAFYQTDSTGPQDAEIMIQLKPEHHATALYEARIRQMLRKQYPSVIGYFQAADIVSQVLNFGLPAALDVQVAGDDLQSDYAIAARLKAKAERIPGIVDLRIPEPLDYPALKINVDRDRALELGITEEQAASALLTALSGNTLIQPSFWLDPKTGVNYDVISQAPINYVNSVQALSRLPILGSPDAAQTNSAQGTSTVSYTPPAQVLGNVATITHGVDPAMIAHYTVHRVVDLDAGVAGRDLAGATAAMRQAIIERCINN